MAITTNVANLSLTRGDTFLHRITVKNEDESLKNITGGSVKYTIRATDYSGAQVLQKTETDGIELLDPINGVLLVTLTAANTQGLVPRSRYVYDCQVTLAGEVATVQTGRLYIIGDISS